jgi:phospholipid/cholesterol/gamma-HCH transport system ATP-binding protein
VQETASIADYIYMISQGKVVEHGSTENLKNSNSDWVRQFMQGLADGPVPFHFPSDDYKADLQANLTAKP